MKKMEICPLSRSQQSFQTMERGALKIMSDMGFNASLLNHVGKQQGRKTIQPKNLILADQMATN